MSNIKTQSRYELIPTNAQLDSLVKFFKQAVDEDYRVSSTQKIIMSFPPVANQFGSLSYLNGVLAYLDVEGFLVKESGGKGSPSTYEAKRLIKESDQIKTREMVGRGKPLRNLNKKVEVEVARRQDTEPVSDTQTTEVTQLAATNDSLSPQPSNPETLAAINTTISGMLSYLQTLPNEMATHLESLTSKLNTVDPSAMERLTNEKKDLYDEVQRLKSQLEEAGNQNYNKHQIYRQRNSIMDEVDRMINAPAWTVRQNSQNFRNSIETKLDAIMEDIGVTTPSN